MIRQTATQTHQQRPTATPAASGLLQRKCACGNHTMAGGKCEGCSKKKRMGLQTKLKVSEPGDIYEQEADRIADQVMASPAHFAVGDAPPRIQCFTGGATEGTAPPSVDSVLASPGRPLDPALQQDMEQRFGYDFSRVRVHSGAVAAQSAHAMRANAYTAGHYIAFATGRFMPAASEGRQLLAHELTHVIQQDRGSGHANALSFVQRQLRSPETLEAESKAESILRAADRAKRESNDRTRMLMNASLIVYRLIDLFLPDYNGKISGVSYEEQLKNIRVDVSGKSFSITVGKQFVFDTGKATLERSALSLGAAILAKMPRENAKRKGLLGVMMEEQQRAPGAKVSFEEALKEGADVLHAAGFGLVCGLRSGQDTGDKYDARDWKEKEGRREVLVAKVEPWLAFTRLVKNLGSNVPAASGGTTRWGFDCFGFVIINRVYAHWRTLTRSEFNSRFKTLELGINSSVNQEWDKPIMSDKPGGVPYISGEVKESHTSGVFEQEKISVRQGWDQLLDSAPVGTQITWGNQDAKTKCTADPELSFCPFMFENTTKVGKNKYSAHPFGVVTREFIEDEMAKAVLNAERKPVTEAAKKAYIKKFIFISGMRVPKKQTTQADAST